MCDLPPPPSDGLQHTTDHDLLVDAAGALTNPARVTVLSTYSSGNRPDQYYDASLADLSLMPAG